MNKAEMKRKNIEEANILMEKRSRPGYKKEEPIVKDTTKKDRLKDKLMNQLKSGN